MPILVVNNVDTIVVHCSATRPNQDIGAKEIDVIHKSPPRKWSGIGYHRVIRRSGAVEHGRSLHAAGAHAYGHNLHTVSICMVGGVGADGKAENNFTPAQFDALRDEIKHLKQAFPNIKDVCGHRDLSPDLNGDGIIEPWEWMKDCPSFNVREWYSRIL